MTRETHIASRTRGQMSGQPPFRFPDASLTLVEKSGESGGGTLCFGTKADTLQAVALRLTKARVLPQICLTVREWQEDSAAVIAQVLNSGWLSNKVIVRSSALAEDRASGSLAGKYRSVDQVQDEGELVRAVLTVIDSYGFYHPEDQIFIQPMLCDVSMSGVAFSVDPNTGAPYVVVNYDEVSGSTSSVTAGHSGDLKTVYLYKYFHPSAWQGRCSQAILDVVELMRELEQLFDTESLDVEFARANGELYLLQVRPLVSAERSYRGDLLPHLQAIAEKVSARNGPHPYLYGTRTLYGIMPDWNPAEMIGVRPRPLALSLYKSIVTDRVWAEQRLAYGYRDLCGFPLLIDLGGLPYMDVRTSFNSFLPADVDGALAEKLVNYYLDQLAASPNKHDKVEFEIVFSCYTFDLKDRLAELKRYGFTDAELQAFERSLHTLTCRILGPEGLWQQDILQMEQLQARYEKIIQSPLPPLDKIYWLLEDCKRYGTLPFAGLARSGFVAVQWLRTLVQTGIFTPADSERFLSSLHTVSSKMARDFGQCEKAEFLRQYGHLRPGTYDILSPRYDEEPESYFDWQARREAVPETGEGFEMSPEQKQLLEEQLAAHEMGLDADRLLSFLRGAIEGREYAKFVFSRSLSEAISLFKQWAGSHGFAPEEAAYADIACVSELYGSGRLEKETLARSIQQGKKKHRLTKSLLLPPLLLHEQDVFAFEMPSFEPNYITQKTAKGPVALLTDREPLTGRIVLIESADPGYDWIFTKGIRGFITLYGGANSHMAIRASELGIPAVIGAGETYYRRWSQAKVIEMDCLNRQVKILQ